ncbi:MAG TPA: thiamine pyrophosphate-binding protein [Gemmatimonadaceae bacterium]|nr:thiamine pyrophosphate-binding protein [Gemmatimonadaceae bacterium]
MRVADYIARALVDHGVRDVFMVTGGGAMHLNDAIGRCEGLRYVCCHHEQACAIAAQGYYRLTNRLAAVNVTTGPGGTNAITGVYGAWVDSLGMIVVSGQVKWETLVRSTGLPLRQLGDQEVDITQLVEPITKYAVMVTDPSMIRFHLEKALYLAREGRPGPVWLDVPINVQAADVDPETLEGFDPATVASTRYEATFASDLERLRGHLATATRPVIYAGAGIRLAGVADEFLQLAERLRVPVATGFNAHDLIPSDHPLFAGRPGTIGDRAGNFAVQNADLLLVLGCRLNLRQISYAWHHFARAAYKVIVDIDAAELAKPTVKADLAIRADVADVVRQLLAEPAPVPDDRQAWIDWCAERRRRYPVVLPEYWTGTSGVNPYCFADALFDELAPDDVVVTGDGTACITTFQAAKLKAGQRLFSDSGSAPMGFDLPAAIGACVAAGGKRIVCVTGDGSLMLNVQELQTIRGYDLPIKLFILNNDGYHSIRQTQRNFFPGNDVGSGPESGVTFPSFERLAYGFDLPFRRCVGHATLASAICSTLAEPGPAVCEIVLDLAQPFAPKVSSKRLPDGRMVTAPLEDMAPFLPRAELLENMLIPAVDSEL